MSNELSHYGSADALADPITDHAYDGIQEYDNPLPGWWKWTFIGSIAFSVCYAMYFHCGAPGRSVAEGFDEALSANMRLQFADIGTLASDEPTILRYSVKASWVKVGQAVFKANCISCHGREGEGKIGPNLTDEFYKNVKKIEDLAQVVSKGAANGAMPAWSNRLHANEVVLVAAYVASLRGSKPTGEAKGPEGNQIAAWPAPPVEPEAIEKTPGKTAKKG